MAPAARFSSDRLMEPALRPCAEIPPPPDLIARLRRDGLLADGEAMALEGGRSNRVWRLRGGAGDLVLKLYDPGAASPLFANDAGREVAVLRALSGSGLAPEPVAAEVGAAVPWVLYHHLPGARWARGAAAVAQVLGAVHRRAAPDLPPGPDGSADLARQVREILSLCPQGGAELAALEPAGHVPACGRRGLIHGDPVPGNIVVQGGRVALIDWQCPALGDPAEDLAIFASPAMQRIYRGAPLSPVELAGFLAAYPDRAVVGRYLALRPWFHWRMAAYCLLQAARGAAAYAEGLALERAALLRDP